MRRVFVRASLFAAVLGVAVRAAAQPIPGSGDWLATPRLGQQPTPRVISPLDVALIRCYRAAIATGKFFQGDVNYVLGQCLRPLNAWTAACEQREGKGAAICLLGPEQAVGEAMQDAWAHRDNLKGWLAELPPLPATGSQQGKGQSGPAGRQ